MHQREATAIKVGIFVFSGMFLAMAVIFLLGSEKQLFKKRYTLFAYFNDISGLRSGAQVQLAGLNVGIVEGISFPEDTTDKKVRVALKLDEDYEERIRKDSVATISNIGLLGDKYVSVSLGAPDQALLKDGETITAQEKPGFDAIVEKAGTLVDSITKTTDSVHNLLEEVEGGQGLLHTLIYETEERPVGRNFAEMTTELKNTSRDLRQIVNKINKGEGTVGAFLQDPSLYYDLRRLFSRVERNKILTHVIRSRVRDLELERVDGKTHEK